MFASSLPPFDDNVQIPAPILVFARLLSPLSNVLRNVLATVYTTNIYMFLGAMSPGREVGGSYSCRRSTRGGSYERRKARLQVLARKFPPNGKADISFINHPKIALVQTRVYCPYLYAVRMCQQLSTHPIFAIYSFRPLQLPNHPCTTTAPPTANNFCSSLSFLSPRIVIGDTRECY